MTQLDWSQTSILVVEDSITQAMQLKSELEEYGIQALIAEDGKKGLVVLKEHTPDAIVCDIEMPNMNGYEFCREIKERASLSRIPIVLLTSLRDPMDVIRGIQCGADNFLTKPCSIRLLLSSIEDAIKNQKLTKKRGKEHTLEVNFAGHKHAIHASQMQVTDLLLSTYSSAIEKNAELEESNRKLGRLHLELQKKNKELTGLNEDKNQFLGMAAHDLRNPLGVIQNYSAILLEKLKGQIEEKYLRMLGNISTSSSLMFHIVNDLLDISSIESGKVKLEIKKIDVQELLEQSVMLNQSLADPKDIEIQLDVAGDIAQIHCDPRRIEQVMNNLLTNAIKFSHEGGKILVLAIPSLDGIMVTVQDQGVGIPKEEQNKLFKTFSRTSAKTTCGETSTGLGLAITKKIIEEHGGAIWVESLPGRGSSFHFSLPAALPSAI